MMGWFLLLFAIDERSLIWCAVGWNFEARVDDWIIAQQKVSAIFHESLSIYNLWCLLKFKKIFRILTRF